MRGRTRIALLALCGLLIAGSSFSGANFTAVSANPSNSFESAASFAPLVVTMDDPGPYLRDTVALTASVDDGAGGSSVSWVRIQRSAAGANTWTDVCTDASSPYSCSLDTTALANGLYDFRATALDVDGDTGTSNVVANRRVDNADPSVTMIDPGTNLRGLITLEATASDTGGSGLASVVIQSSPAGANTWTDVCTDTTSPYQCPVDTATIGDGVFDFRAVASDNAGNTADSVVANRRIDNGAPTPVTIADPGSPLSGSTTLTGNASDSGSGVASWKAQYSPAGANSWTDVCTDPSSPYSCPLDTSTLTDGLYDFRAVATDVAGNSAASSVRANRRVDNADPTVTMSDPGAYLRATLTLQATASDGGGVASVVIQRSPAGANTWTNVCTDTSSPYACPLDTRTVADGLYDLRAVATDNAGRTAGSVVANRRIDNAQPSVTMNDPGAYLRLTVSLTASASDTGGSGVASVVVQRSPAGADTWTNVCTDTSSPYSCPLDTTTLADGLYDFKAVATDNAGNANSSTVASRRIDNAQPSVTMNDPGAYIRATVTLTANASDGSGSGVASVVMQRSPAGANTWTDVCTDSSSPYSCSLDTTTLTDGALYDFRAVATDNAANQQTSVVVANRRVDNTRPTGIDVQAADGGGSTGKIQTGDSITFTFTETLLPSSVLSGWTGASTAVVVRVDDNASNDKLRVFDSTDATLAALTDAASNGVSLNGNYVPSGGAKFNATMVQSGTTITITLGTVRSGGVNATRVGNATMSWTPSSVATDAAGNTAQNTSVSELGSADRDF